jgi:hypothetical protein
VGAGPIGHTSEDLAAAALDGTWALLMPALVGVATVS